MQKVTSLVDVRYIPFLKQEQGAKIFYKDLREQNSNQHQVEKLKNEMISRRDNENVVILH